MSNETQWYATGRRKEAAARVFLRPGTGEITVNSRSLESYFPRKTSRLIVMQPLALTENVGQVDIFVTVKGGGPTGQAGAVRLGIARALAARNLADRPVLKKSGLLTRDARKVERKKYGQPGARKRFQFSKR